VILRSLATTRGAEHLVYGEALAASRVNHPNVVTVFDVIEHEGMPCIVMELLDGESLGAYFARKGCLSVSEAMSLLLPAMRGVACANAQGVVHRDLKPQNIFICIGPDGHILTTKVLDFGISVMMERVVATSAGSSLALEMGTPAYMAPEHISGERRIDERADVYGFGVLLYEALSGHLPFPGEPGPELFQRVLQEPAPPLTQFRRDLPQGLVRIIEAAMAKEPDHRYSDLNLMVSALENEVLLPAPVSRLITPLVGAPSFTLHEVLSGASVAQAIPRGEASRPHQETKMLFAFPLKKENEKRASSNGANCGLDDRSAEVRSPLATGRETVLLRVGRHVREPLSRIKSFSAVRARLVLALRPRSLSALCAWSLFALRGRRGWVAGGIAVMLAIAGWMATRAVGHALRAVPASVASVSRAAGPLVAPPAVPAAEPAAIVVPGTLPVPLTASPSPPAPGTVADAGYRKPASRVRARGTVSARGLAEARPRAPRSGASMKSAAPRAGKLSADDF
jgi:serine/threonine protein kinase